MKIIVTHDIDHFTFSEHWKDLYILKYIIRAKLEWFTGKISLKEVLLRIQKICTDRNNNLEKLIAFDRAHQVASTFFIGVNKGKGLVYKRKRAKQCIHLMRNEGFECGVHGNAGSNLYAIRKERCLFMALEGPEDVGIRMHYLHLKSDTLDFLAQAGYFFDSSEYACKSPYLIGNMWEFPFQLMDTYEIENGKAWQKNSLETAKKSTLNKILQAEQAGLPYLIIIFHDCYYSDAFLTWKLWYEWLISYCNEKGMEFISFSEAVIELQNLPNE